MKKLSFVFAIAMAGMASLRAAEPIVPVVELRVQAVNDLLGYAAYVGGMVGQEEQFEQYANAAKAFAGKKGLEGFDMKRPLGLYAGVTKDVVDSPVVLVLPIIDEAAVLSLFNDKLNAKVKKGEDGVYETKIPQVPQPIFFKFADGYLHATIGNKANLDRVLSPKTFFAEKSKSLAALTVHLDRMPADVKKVILGQVEFQMQKEKDRMKKEEPSISKRALAGYVLDATPALLKTIFDDGKSLAVSLNLDPTTDDVTAEMKLTPKPGTALATAMATAGKKSTTTAGRIPGANPMLAASINFALSEKWKDKLVPVVDDLLNEADAQAEPTFGEYLKKILTSFEPTMKLGDFDFAVVLNGPDDAGKHKLHGFLKSKKLLNLVDAFQDLAKILPASIIESKFDTVKVDGSGVHSLTFHEQSGKLEELFDSKTMYVGVKDELLSFGFEPEGKVLKAALAAMPESKSVFAAEVAVSRMVMMTADAEKKPKLQKKLKEIFGSSPTTNADTLKLIVTAGDDVKIRLTSKGKALQAFQALDQVNKE